MGVWVGYFKTGGIGSPVQRRAVGVVAALNVVPGRQGVGNSGGAVDAADYS